MMILFWLHYSERVNILKKEKSYSFLYLIITRFNRKYTTLLNIEIGSNIFQHTIFWNYYLMTETKLAEFLQY